MNCFLKTRKELDACTAFLEEAGLVAHGLSCKNYDIAMVIPQLKDGNLLDMGSDGSWVLENAAKKNLKGLKIGIDLAYPENKTLPNGIDLVRGDLMNTPFPDGFFNYITCLSVVEHQVDFDKLAKECFRLLSKGGRVYLSCDYWEPKPDTSKMKLYSLDWNILDKNDVIELVASFTYEGLNITSPMDWKTQDAVIDDTFCSPAPGVAYTFGVFSFEKS